MSRHSYWIVIEGKKAFKTDDYTNAINMLASWLCIMWRNEGMNRGVQDEYAYEEAQHEAFFMWTQCIENTGGDVTRDGITVRITIRS